MIPDALIPDALIVTPEPTTILVAVAAPNTGVTRVGEVANTSAPVPVSSVTADIKFALDGVARKVATLAPRPSTPVETGSPVQLVRVPELGVPNTGVTRVGLVANTAEPEPVSSVRAVARLAELKEPNDVVVLTDVIAPVKLGILVVDDAVPVKFPTKPLVAVMTPDATTLVKEIFGSRLTVTVLDAADEVKLVPPEIVKVSLRRSIFSEPESPETVNPEPTAAVVTEVTRPLALTVTTGIRVCEPKDPTLLLTVANVPVPVTLPVPSNDPLVYAKSPVIAIVLPVAS